MVTISGSFVLTVGCFLVFLVGCFLLGVLDPMPGDTPRLQSRGLVSTGREDRVMGRLKLRTCI